MTKKNIKVKVELTRRDAIAYIREGLRRENLVTPDDDTAFIINGDAVNDEDVLVEVADVSVGPAPQERGVSLSELRQARAADSPAKEEPPPKKRRDPDEERTLTNDEDPEAIEKELKRFHKSMPASPAKGKDAPEAATLTRKRFVGETLEDLGKDPKDMSDEI